MVINFFGGPGAGKSTNAAGLFYLMKQAGMKVELVTEYAKELTYEERFNVLQEDQLYILAHQYRRMKRLHNKVDYIVTDSPLFLSVIYGRHFQNNNKHLEKYTLDLINQYNNINLFIVRNLEEHPFKKYGRNQTKEESIFLDSSVKRLLNEFKIDYTRFTAKKDTLVPELFDFITSK
jgi:tRNA uridine 5-carbamoylmethylation protein Kti12